MFEQPKFGSDAPPRFSFVHRQPSQEPSHPLGKSVVQPPSSGIHRRRHPEWKAARFYIMQHTFEWRDAYESRNQVVSCAKSYCTDTEEKMIMLRNRETDQLLFIPYTHRFQDAYYKAAIKKMRKIKCRDAVFLTLTIDPKRFTSLLDCYRGLQLNWNRLLTVLRKRFKKRLHFIRIIEFTHEGIPHLHVLFLNLKRLIDADELREFWDKKYGMAIMVHIKHIHNDRGQATRYIIKYLQKIFLDEETDLILKEVKTPSCPFNQRALGWALNLRIFSTSRGILDNPPDQVKLPQGVWELVGIVAAVDAALWIGKTWSQIENEFYESYGPGANDFF